MLSLSISSSHVNAQKAANSRFKMVHQGSSRSVIQIAENADSDERLAATELSDYVFKIAGARIPVVSKKAIQIQSFTLGALVQITQLLLKKNMPLRALIMHYK